MGMVAREQHIGDAPGGEPVLGRPRDRGLAEALAQQPEAVLGDRAHQRRLVVEMAIERHRRHAGALGDGAQVEVLRTFGVQDVESDGERRMTEIAVVVTFLDRDSLHVYQIYMRSRREVKWSRRSRTNFSRRNGCTRPAMPATAGRNSANV